MARNCVVCILLFFLNTYILYVPITFVQLFTFFLSPNDGLRNGGWWIGFLCSTVIGFPITWSGSVTYLTVCEISHAKFAFRLSLQLLSGHSFRSEKSFNMCHDWWQFIRSDAALCSRLDFKIQLLPLCLSLVHKCRMYNSSHSVWWRSRPPGTVVTKERRQNKPKKKKKTFRVCQPQTPISNQIPITRLQMLTQRSARPSSSTCGKEKIKS